jgi:long-chain fatty acid transport protein
MSWRLGAALGVAAAWITAPAIATTGSVLAVGPRSLALAGASATQDIGVESTAQNPANLALEHRPQLTAGYALTRPRLFITRQGHPEERVDEAAFGTTELGFTLPFYFADEPLVLGLISDTPGGSVAQARLPLAKQPQFPLLSRARALDFDLALGFRPLGILALGAGVRALASLGGSASVERSGATTTTHVSDSLKPVLAPYAGLTAFLNDRAQLALVLRAPLESDFDVELAPVDLGATKLPALHLSGVAQYDPLSLHAEYAQRVGPITGVFGATYERYRRTPAFLPATVTCPPSRPVCAAETASAPGFHDTVDLHVASRVDFRLARAALAELRAGYAFVPSPVPEQTGPANLLDCARHRVGFGYGVAFDAPLPPLSLDMALGLDELVPRTSQKAETVDAQNPGAPSLRARGKLWSLGLSLTAKL